VGGGTGAAFAAAGDEVLVTALSATFAERAK